MSSKLYTYFLNAESSKFVFLFTCVSNIDFDDIMIAFTDENGRPLEKEEKVTLTLLINKQK